MNPSFSAEIAVSYSVERVSVADHTYTEGEKTKISEYSDREDEWNRGSMSQEVCSTDYSVPCHAREGSGAEEMRANPLMRPVASVAAGRFEQLPAQASCEGGTPSSVIVWLCVYAYVRIRPYICTSVRSNARGISRSIYTATKTHLLIYDTMLHDATQEYTPLAHINSIRLVAGPPVLLREGSTGRGIAQKRLRIGSGTHQTGAGGAIHHGIGNPPCMPRRWRDATAFKVVGHWLAPSSRRRGARAGGGTSPTPGCARANWHARHHSPLHG